MKLKLFAVRNLSIISLVLALAVGALVSTPTLATDFSIQGGANAAKGTDQVSDLFGTTGIFTTITNIMMFILGAVSVIMIIFGGLRYVISGGDSTSVTAAKNTILYAVVGVIIALLAYAIVNFVIGSLAPGSGTGGASTSV